MPAIAQDRSNGQVLMLAWMNDAALRQSIETGYMTYWSRSRSEMWVKGETSGHYQLIRSIRIDCDGDAILCLVDQTGSACHTGRRNCFYLHLNSEQCYAEIVSN